MGEPQKSSRAVSSPDEFKPVWSVPLGNRVHPALWIATAAAILAMDFLTGPFVQVAILFVVPVALATWSQGKIWGSVVAVVLPLARLPVFYLVWRVPNSWALEFVDTGIDVAVLLGMTQIIDYVARQRREILVLEGMLPICLFCKRIRDDCGKWRQLESYITQRSEAKFTHTFCPECGRVHYGDLAE